MFDFSRVLGILAFIVQILNVAAYLADVIAPEYGVLVAGVTAAIQAFTRSVTGAELKK